MAISAQSSTNPMVDMNITPLVDVMLVLLVIFMIAAPIISTPIPLRLNGKPPIEEQTPPPTLELRIDASGQVFVDGRPVPMSALPSMFSAEVERADARSPAMKIHANGEADYQVIAKVLAVAENAGVRNIAFVR